MSRTVCRPIDQSATQWLFVPPTWLRLTLVSLFVCLGSPLWAADDVDLEPILRVDTGGPSSYVTSLVFGNDGQTLYAAGWDKIVRAWTPAERPLHFRPSAFGSRPHRPAIGRRDQRDGHFT